MLDTPEFRDFAVVPFYQNTQDNTHCHQACIQMVLKYFLPAKDYTFDELDALSGKTPGKWTWPLKTMVELKALGFDVLMCELFDMEEFIKTPEQYLLKRFGEEMGKAQIDNSNIPQEVEYAKGFASADTYRNKVPTLDDLRELLSDGYLVCVNVNYHLLYDIRSTKYSGHLILILNIDMESQTITFHDPGLPAKPNATILLENFKKAWEYPDGDSQNYEAFRLKLKA